MRKMLREYFTLFRQLIDKNLKQKSSCSIPRSGASSLCRCVHVPFILYPSGSCGSDSERCLISEYSVIDKGRSRSGAFVPLITSH